MTFLGFCFLLLPYVCGACFVVRWAGTVNLRYLRELGDQEEEREKKNNHDFPPHCDELPSPSKAAIVTSCFISGSCLKSNIDRTGIHTQQREEGVELGGRSS